MKFLDKKVFTNKAHVLIRSASSAITLLLILFCISRNNNDLKFNNMLFEFISDFQTLIAGIFAIWAAWFTVNAMNKQTERMERIELERHKQQQQQINAYQKERDEDKLKKSFIVKAKLPNALTEYTDYIEELFFELWQKQTAPKLNRPISLIKLMENNIQYCDLSVARYFQFFIKTDLILHNQLKVYNDTTMESDVVLKILTLNGICKELLDYSQNNKLSNRNNLKSKIEDCFNGWMKEEKSSNYPHSLTYFDGNYTQVKNIENRAKVIRDRIFNECNSFGYIK